MVEQELVHAIEAVLNSKKKLSKAESKVTSGSKTFHQPGIHGARSGRFGDCSELVRNFQNLFGPVLDFLNFPVLNCLDQFGSVDPSYQPPIQKPQLTFYHLRDDLCFYWVKITFWFWLFLFSQGRSSRTVLVFEWRWRYSRYWLRTWSRCVVINVHCNFEPSPSNHHIHQFESFDIFMVFVLLFAFGLFAIPIHYLIQIIIIRMIRG